MTHNLVTVAGANKLLDAAFKSGLAAPAWYVGLIAGSAEPIFEVADTMEAHAGWSEIAAADVSEARRQAWTPGAIASGAVDNSGAQAMYHMRSAITLAGLFMVDEDTIGATSGTLYGEAAFAAGQEVQDGYTVTVTATLSIGAG